MSLAVINGWPLACGPWRPPYVNPTPRSNTMVIQGDSRAAGGFLDGAKRNKSTNNEIMQANRVLGNRIQIVGNFATAGQTTIQQLAYLRQALATRAGHYCLQTGVNDIPAGILTGNPAYPGDQLDTSWGAMWFMVESARLAGMHVWLYREPGAANFTAPQIASRDALNAKIDAYAAQWPDKVTLIDMPTWGLVDPTRTDAVVWKTDPAGDLITSDGIHRTTVGGGYIGRTHLAPLFATRIPAVAVAPYDTAAFVPGSGSPILTPNPMFRVTTGGGSVGSGNSGTLPGSCSGSRIGGSSAAFSFTPSADGNGNDLIMVVTNTGSVANDRARVSMNLNTAAMSGQQWLETGGEIDVAAGARGIQSVTLGTNFSTNGTQNFNNDAISDITRLGDRGGYSGIELHTDPLYVVAPVSATPSFFLTAYAYPGEDGVATIRFRHPWARLLTYGSYPF